MRRLVALLALLIPFAASAAADSATSPSPATPRSASTARTSTTCSASRPTQLVAVAGESKAAIGGLPAGRGPADRRRRVLPLDDDAAPSPSATTATPYTRVWLDMECPQEQGAFRVDYDLPMENVVDYELGGAKGTFLFDPDHTLDDRRQPAASRASSRRASSTSCSAGTTSLFLVILLLGASSLRDVLELATAFTRRPQRHARARGARRGQRPERDRRAADRRVDRLRGGRCRCSASSRARSCSVVFAFGLLHGLGFAGAVTFPDGTPILSALIGFNVGIELGQAHDHRRRLPAAAGRPPLPVVAASRRPRRAPRPPLWACSGCRSACWAAEPGLVRRQRQRAARAPGRAAAARRSTHITVSSPAASASTPSSAAAMPPTPIAKPERDAGRDPEPARQVLLPHHDRDAERHHGHEADRRPAARRRRARSGASMKPSSSGIWATIEPTQHPAAADPVDQPPADERPERARDEHRGERGVASRLARAVLADQPDRREGLQAEVDPRADRDDARSAVPNAPQSSSLRSAAVGAGGALGRGAGAARAQRAAARTPARRRPAPAAIATSSVPREAEDEHGGRDQDRAEREAGVAADAEQAHARSRGASPRA